MKPIFFHVLLVPSGACTTIFGTFWHPMLSYGFPDQISLKHRVLLRIISNKRLVPSILGSPISVILLFHCFLFCTFWCAIFSIKINFFLWLFFKITSTLVNSKKVSKIQLFFLNLLTFFIIFYDLIYSETTFECSLKNLLAFFLTIFTKKFMLSFFTRLLLVYSFANLIITFFSNILWFFYRSKAFLNLEFLYFFIQIFEQLIIVK